jgi:hypothetical protein
VMQNCYTGAAGTLGVGTCMHGSQTCASNKFGACTGAIMPMAETCANEAADDDCDGMTDNVPTRGDACTVVSNAGVCRVGTLQCQSGDLGCSTPAPAASEACDGRDDDCDGMTDEGFNLQTDTAHCGACDMQCDSGQGCCAGHCTDQANDANNCGTCGNACGSGQDCCGGQCFNLQADANNCGTCGNKCANGSSCCGAQCTDRQSDENNCGSCGHVCSAGLLCCAGGCIDPRSNNSNCGVCGKRCALATGGLTCNCKNSICSGLCL